MVRMNNENSLESINYEWMVMEEWVDVEGNWLDRINDVLLGQGQNILEAVNVAGHRNECKHLLDGDKQSR